MCLSLDVDLGLALDLTDTRESSCQCIYCRPTVCMYAHVCVCVCMHMCVFVCVCVCMHIHDVNTCMLSISLTRESHLANA